MVRKERFHNVITVFKYRLAFTAIQSIKCAYSKILDIQIQEGWPVIWVLVDSALPERDLSIVRIETGNHAPTHLDNEMYRYLSTTQTTDGYVCHWWVNCEEDI